MLAIIAAKAFFLFLGGGGVVVWLLGLCWSVPYGCSEDSTEWIVPGSGIGRVRLPSGQETPLLKSRNFPFPSRFGSCKVSDWDLAHQEELASVISLWQEQDIQTCKASHALLFPHQVIVDLFIDSLRKGVIGYSGTWKWKAMVTHTVSAQAQAGVIKRRSDLNRSTWPGWYPESHWEVLAEDKHCRALSLQDGKWKSQGGSRCHSSQSPIPPASPAN